MKALPGWALAAAILAALWLAWPRPPLYDGMVFSQAVYDRGGRLLRLTATTDGKFRLWVPLREISPLMIRATILQEDQHFRKHPGFNPLALVRAAWMTYIVGERRIGGSTITMQLARLKYRIDSKTPTGKLRQLKRAMELELFYSKDEILEAYLNLAPYGGNIEGVAAASLIYFEKNPDQLNLSEAMTLCVIPQNPVRRTLAGWLNVRDQTSRWKARLSLWRRWIKGQAPDQAKASVIDFAPAPRRASPVFKAPHFVDAVLAHQRPGRTLSTLDLTLQQLLERLTKSYLERRRKHGLKNAAAMLLDYRTMDVLAEVGSADYFDSSIAGQNNGARARRSPGSTLKPLVYGLAFDQGLLYPQSVLKDAPTAFGAFNPENFDGDFTGPVTARQALIKSRNVPAVSVAAALKPPGFYGLLKDGLVALPREPDYYGLGLVLGTAEVTMGELAQFYAMLANGGLHRPLRRVLGQRPSSKRLLSREASFLVMDILKDTPRPSQANAAWAPAAGRVYWKTGTSYGFRDAWTAGVLGPYVLVVWIGDFSGKGNPAYVGVEAAAPLFFEIADALRARPGDMTDAFAQSLHGLNIAAADVCAASGKAVTPLCPRKVASWIIPGVSPIDRCDVHREVLVDLNTGKRLCAPSARARAEVFEFWPSDLLRVLRQSGLPRREPPPFDSLCGLAAKGRGLAPRISSPLASVSYLVRPETNDSISFSAVTDADAAWLYWFLDEQLVGKTPAGKPLFWAAKPGRYVVRVIDDQGRADHRELAVALAN